MVHRSEGVLQVADIPSNVRQWRTDRRFGYCQGTDIVGRAGRDDQGGHQINKSVAFIYFDDVQNKTFFSCIFMNE